MNKLTELRLKANINMAQLAKRAELTTVYIHELECGKKNNPSFNTLKKLAQALNVSVNELMD